MKLLNSAKKFYSIWFKPDQFNLPLRMRLEIGHRERLFFHAEAAQAYADQLAALRDGDLAEFERASKRGSTALDRFKRAGGDFN